MKKVKASTFSFTVPTQIQFHYYYISKKYKLARLTLVFRRIVTLKFFFRISLSFCWEQGTKYLSNLKQAGSFPDSRTSLPCHQAFSYYRKIVIQVRQMTVLWASAQLNSVKTATGSVGSLMDLRLILDKLKFRHACSEISTQ